MLSPKACSRSRKITNKLKAFDEFGILALFNVPIYNKIKIECAIIVCFCLISAGLILIRLWGQVGALNNNKRDLNRKTAQSDAGLLFRYPPCLSDGKIHPARLSLKTFAGGRFPRNAA